MIIVLVTTALLDSVLTLPDLLSELRLFLLYIAGGVRLQGSHSQKVGDVSFGFKAKSTTFV